MRFNLSPAQILVTSLIEKNLAALHAGLQYHI